MRSLVVAGLLIAALLPAPARAETRKVDCDSQAVEFGGPEYTSTKMVFSLTIHARACFPGFGFDVAGDLERSALFEKTHDRVHRLCRPRQRICRAVLSLPHGPVDRADYTGNFVVHVVYRGMYSSPFRAGFEGLRCTSAILIHQCGTP